MLRRQVYLLIGLVLCYPVCRPLAFFSRDFYTPPRPLIFLWKSRIQAARRSELLFSSSTCHLAMNRSAASRTPRFHSPLSLLHGPTVRFQLQLPWGTTRRAFGGSKNGEVVSQGSEPVVQWSTWSRIISTGHLRKHHPTGQPPLALPYHCPSEKEPPFLDSRFNSLALRLLEGLGVREVCVVGTTLEAKDTPEDFEVRLLELVIVSRVGGPRHAPVQQRLNHLGLQQEHLQAEPGGRLFFTLLISSFLDKPWSQVSFLLPHGSCLQFFIAHRVPQSHCSSIFH